jgi:hypothetical protein
MKEKLALLIFSLLPEHRMVGKRGFSMKRYFLLILGLILWTASPVSSQVTFSLDGGSGTGDQVIRLGNRPVVGQIAQAQVPGADNSVNDNSGASPNIAPAANEIFRFGTMVGVSGALVGTDLIREVPAGQRPWQITRGDGRLMNDGQLRIDVEGLVLVEDGTNPVVAFRGLVSCLTADGGVANVLTGEFIADPAGNAQIEETIEIPGSCFAPIVFVTSTDGNWFASTGK